MAVYTHQLKNWPGFTWDHEKIGPVLATVRHQQGRLLGRIEGMGPAFQTDVHLNTLVLDVVTSGEIAGMVPDLDGVRSVIAERMEGDAAIKGMIEVALDATQNHGLPLTNERLFHWETLLSHSLQDASSKTPHDHYRDNSGLRRSDRLQEDRKKVHFQAPDSHRLEQEMAKLLRWFNRIGSLDPVIKAAITHLLFVTIHPFPENVDRIAGVVTDMQLRRADMTIQRCYSLSAQIRKEQQAYHKILERTQKTAPDITDWLDWFLNCLGHAIAGAGEKMAGVWRMAQFWGAHQTASFNTRQKTMLNLLLEGLDGKLTSSKWARITASSQDTAGRDIGDLLQRGILLKETRGGRSTSYQLAFPLSNTIFAKI